MVLKGVFDKIIEEGFCTNFSGQKMLYDCRRIYYSVNN